MADNQLIHATPAPVRFVADEQRNATLLAILRERHAQDADSLDEDELFFWRAIISNDGVDAYYTHMAESTLRNFASAAQAGISFQNSHNFRELPLGRSLAGSLHEGDERAEVLADFYTVKGLRLGSTNTDDFIRGVRSGIVSDVSVGFYGGRHACDLCGRNYYSWDCPHVAGLEYEEEGQDGVVRGSLATVTIEDARLSEVSAVYDGATPGAAILKAERMVEAGTLRRKDAEILETRYRIRLAGQRIWEAPQIEEEAESDVTVEERMQAIEALLREEGYEGDAPDTVRSLLDAMQRGQERQAELESQVAELTPLAADGRQYRSDLLADALAEGVRAHGEGFDQDTYQVLLESAPLSTIKRMRDDWGQLAQQRFPGGRQTDEEAEMAAPQDEQEETRRRVYVPETAFKS